MIRTDFKSYFDGQGLLSPQPNPGLIGSDNGPMFLSEYYLILLKHGELTGEDREEYRGKIASCMNDDGTLNRVRHPHKASQTGPDDYLAVLNGCFHLAIQEIPRRILRSIFRHYGFLNNVESGGWSRESFLIRQPQLVAAMVAASFPTWSFTDRIARLLAFPFFAWAALVILVSCRNADPNDTDARRLAWHLVQCTEKVSSLCRLAARGWYDRLFQTYGADGMRAVAAIYYQPRGENPYSKHWRTV